MKNKQNNKASTLCWDCKNAVAGCSWSKSFIPVVGWEAEKTVIHEYALIGGMQSYKVNKCPEFIAEEEYAKKLPAKKKK